MRHSTKSYLLLTMVVFFVGLAMFVGTVSTRADSPLPDQNPQYQYHSIQLQAATETATPTPAPMEFTEQELAEGRPTGIIIGAGALVLLIILGTLITLSRRSNKK
jgi:hypothetical protein